MLFNSFKKSYNIGLEETLTKFADHTKLGEAVHSFEDQKALQRDLDKLQGWEITGCRSLTRASREINNKEKKPAVL